MLLHTWRQRWEAKKLEWRLTGVSQPQESSLKLHSRLHKAESAVITQIRTECIGLAAFLNKARVPDFPSLVCQCGRARETARHVILHCNRFMAARHKIADPRSGVVDLKSLLSCAVGSRQLAQWFIQLRSFSWPGN